jgi:hypothetical protein
MAIESMDWTQTFTIIGTISALVFWIDKRTREEIKEWKIEHSKQIEKMDERFNKMDEKWEDRTNKIDEKWERLFERLFLKENPTGK